MSEFLLLRTLLDVFGHRKLKIAQMKWQILSLILGFLALAMIKWQILILFVFEIAVPVIITIKKRGRKIKYDKILFVDELILNMKAGISFETSYATAVQSTNGWEKFEKSDAKMSQLTSFCRKNSSLSFKALSFFRETEKLRQKLHTKQETVSLQAKAQAIVSVFLYLVIFLAQWAWNADFKMIFQFSGGRLIFFFSLLLMAIGIFLVFKMAQTKDLEV